MSRPQNSCCTILRPPKTVFEPHIEPKNSPLGPKIVKNYPKIKSKLNVRIEGNIENDRCSTKLVNPKTVFKPYPKPKNSLLEPPKSKK